MGKRESIPTHYYISPQIWAWKKIASLTSKDVDKYFTLWKTFYEDKHNFPVEFVGHPIDAIHNHPIVDSTKFRIENQLDENQYRLTSGSSKK
jgi:lipid-A-disaccharide synthase